MVEWDGLAPTREYKPLQPSFPMSLKKESGLQHIEAKVHLHDLAEERVILGTPEFLLPE
jgi:hypothetical protein